MSTQELSLLLVATIPLVAIVGIAYLVHIIQNARKPKPEPLTEVSIDIIKYRDNYKVRKTLSDGSWRFLKEAIWRTTPEWQRWKGYDTMTCYGSNFDTEEDAQKALDECLSTPYDESYDKVQVVRTTSVKQPDSYLTLTPELMDAVREGNRDKEIEILGRMEKLRQV